MVEKAMTKNTLEGRIPRISPAQRAAMGAARARYRRRLQEVLDAQGLNGATLAKILHVSSVTVYRTLSGTLHSAAVLEWLRVNGASEKHLCDPNLVSHGASSHE